MSFYNGPTILTNGLVLSLDAADRNSYTENVYPNPTDIFAYVGAAGGNNCTLSRDTTIDLSPAGGTPLKMAITGNDPYTNAWASPTYSFVSASAGQTWTFSCWIKASTNTDAQLFMFGANSSGANVETYVVSFNNITTTWQRFSITRQLQNNNTVALQVRFDGTGSGGNGINIWFDGAQVERNSLTSPFNNKTNWFDLSNNSNNGTLTSGQTFNSANGGGIVFNGSNNTVNISTLDLRQNFTYLCWVNHSSVNGFAFLGQGTTSTNNGLHVFFYTDSNIRFGMYSNDTDVLSLTTATNTWYQYVFTYNHTSYVKQIYRNAVQLTGTPTGTQAQYSGTGIVRIGATYSSGGSYANGRFATATIYNRVLTASEILQNYNATKSRFGL